MNRILLIQTAFTGDVVLATPLIEKLHRFYPGAKIDFLLKKGNEGLLTGHPLLDEVLIFDKKNGKLKNLFSLLRRIRRKKYDVVVNMHRFGSSGFLTAFSGAEEKIGFDKNPWSRFFTKRIAHEIGNGKHEVRRNLELIQHLTDSQPERPKLYPSEADYKHVSFHKSSGKYVCMAPTSVWFTKQWPEEKWVELIKLVPREFRIFLLGAPSDNKTCEDILRNSRHGNIANLAGHLSFLQSAALMESASMNFVNDSAPMHFASAMNAPVTAIFCSTVPAFGFGPLSDKSFVAETKEKLSCRPCGLHGYKACPEGHFRCALEIDPAEVVKNLSGR
ncbi:MAG TPA: glycosyltransferase family 9 protein [Bacteroidia bacterium]|nr:glycosyltransferase family 9 protein [Bacteroidia bacterium]